MGFKSQGLDLLCFCSLSPSHGENKRGEKVLWNERSGRRTKTNICMALYLITIPMVITFPFHDDNSYDCSNHSQLVHTLCQ